MSIALRVNKAEKFFNTNYISKIISSMSNIEYTAKSPKASSGPIRTGAKGVMS